MMLAGSIDHARTTTGPTTVVNYGIATTVRDVVHKGGARGLYAGCMVNALTSGPAAAITFSANDFLRDILGYERSNN